MSTFTINRLRKINKSLVSIIVFALIIAAFLLAVNYTSAASLTHQEDALTRALERDIIMCYAKNGFYPPSLDYIIDHYGLLYDDELFFVSYTPIADNIHPSVTIIRQGGQHE